MSSAYHLLPSRSRLHATWKTMRGRLALLPRLRGRAGLALAGVVTGSLGAQTTFLGTWTEWAVPRILDAPYSVYVQPDPSPNYVFEYRPILQVDVSGNKTTQLHWLVWPILSPGQAGGTFFDNHWSNANVWSNGRPDTAADVLLLESAQLALPAANSTTEAPATARSLALFDSRKNEAGNYTAQFVTLSDGLLSLTPLALGESLRVGIASADGKPRATTLILSGSTLTSTGIAMIGVGATAGGGGTLTGIMQLQGGAQWLHPAGLIEVGGGTGEGLLRLAGGLLAGSLLAGTTVDPRVVIRPGSQFVIARGATTRLSELIVDSFNGSNITNGFQGLEVQGSLTTEKLVVGQTAGSRAYFETGAVTADLGETLVDRNSQLELVSTTAKAVLLELLHGSATIKDNSFLTLGDPAVANDTTPRLRLAGGQNTSAFLLIRGNDGDPASVTVHGTALLGLASSASVTIDQGGTLDVRGKTSLGHADSSVAGTGTLSVMGTGSVFRTQTLEVGYSYFDSYSFNPYPSPTGSLTIGAGGKVAIAGRTESYSGGTLVYNYAGEVMLGKNGTLTLSHDTSTLLFTDPSNGGILNSQASLTNHGRIQGGGTAGGGAQIDFRQVGGGTLTNHGTISPGHSAGWLTIAGDLRLSSLGSLLLELGGTTRGSGYDVLTVTGAVTIGGTLTVTLINGFNPVSGTSFDLLDFGSSSGTFAAISLPAGYTWNTDALYTTGTISVAAVPEPSTYALGAGLGAGLAALLRRRRRPRGLVEG